MEQLLTEWGFPEYINIFKEQEIDEDALLCLNDSNLAELIPKIGPRMKFARELKQFQEIHATPIIIDSAGDEIELLEDSGNELRLMASSTPSPSGTFSSEGDDTAQSVVALETGNAFRLATKRKLAFCGEATLKKACRGVYSLDMRQFLNTTITGRFVVNSYEKDKKLTRKLRNQLAYILISGLMSEESGRLIPIDFEILAEKIHEIFPTETKSTYYIPRVPGNKNKKPINAKGKLVDKYRNLCRLYNLNAKKEFDNEEAMSSPNMLNDADMPNDDEIKNCVEWLKTYQEPWETVLTNWEKTYCYRKNNTSATVDSFINDWPILKHREAYDLVLFDFKMLFPDCEISLLREYQKWEHFFNKIKNLKKLDRASEQFIDQLNSNISQDSKNAIQIAALPMLLPPRGRIRCNKSHWKPSILECQESLLNLVHTCGNIEELKLRRRNKLAKLKLTVQPYVVVVGASFSAITESYLVIDDNIYKTSSVLQSLDFAFKSFHALNASYPKESEHIWLIIEQAMYNIRTTAVEIPSVLTTLTDLGVDIDVTN